VLPIQQAIDILENDLSSEAGKKGIISITAGVSDPERTDYKIENSCRFIQS